MTEKDTEARDRLAEVAYSAFGHYIAGENVTFGCGLPFGQLPVAVQAGFLEVPAAILAATAPEAPPSVTVTTPCGPVALAADTWDRRPDKSLLVSLDGRPAAEFTEHGWSGVLHDACRAPSEPAPNATAMIALWQVLREVEDAAADDAYDDEQARESINAIIRRYRATGK